MLQGSAVARIEWVSHNNESAKSPPTDILSLSGRVALCHRYTSHSLSSLAAEACINLHCNYHVSVQVATMDDQGMLA